MFHSALEHQTTSCVWDILLAVPDQREQPFDLGDRQQRLSEQRGPLQPMQYQPLLEGFRERIRRGLVRGPQPRLQLP